MGDEAPGGSTPSDRRGGREPAEKIQESLNRIVNEMAAVLAACLPSERKKIWELFLGLVSRRVSRLEQIADQDVRDPQAVPGNGVDVLASEGVDTRVPKQLQNPTESAPEQLAPAVLAWARQLFSENEIIAGLQEIRQTGGQELKDFIRDPERVAGDDA